MKKYTNEDYNKDRDRFRLLLEYDFYIGEEEIYDPQEELDGEIITEEPPKDDAPEDAPEGGDEFGGDEFGGDEAPADDAPEGGDEFGGDEFGGEDEAPEEEMPAPEELPEPEPMEDEVELDVTQLVQGTEEAKASADRAGQQIAILMSKFDNLTASIEKMSAINKKIEELEHEVEKRNPTPQEKLEMRSLDSYPYSLKLTDYWAEKEGNYDVMGGKENEEKEYVLTQDEVDNDYNPIEIKDSFDETVPEKKFRRF